MKPNKMEGQSRDSLPSLTQHCGVSANSKTYLPLSFVSQTTLTSSEAALPWKRVHNVLSVTFSKFPKCTSKSCSPAADKTQADVRHPKCDVSPPPLQFATHCLVGAMHSFWTCDHGMIERSYTRWRLWGVGGEVITSRCILLTFLGFCLIFELQNAFTESLEGKIFGAPCHIM